MNQRSLTEVLLKVLGVWSIIKAIDYIAQILSLLIAHNPASDSGFSSETLLELLAFVVVPIFYLPIAFLLLRYAEPIAARIFPNPGTSIPEGVRPKNEWYVFAFTVVGVVLLVWKVPVDIAICLNNFVALREFKDTQWLDAPGPNNLRHYAWQALLRAVMQLGLGLYLVLGARGICAGIRKLRRE